MTLLWVLVGLVAGAVLGAIGAPFLLRTRGQAHLRDAQTRAGRARSDAETEAKELILAAKEEAHRTRTTAEDEVRARQKEVLELEQRVQQREESFIRSLDELEKRQESIREAEKRHLEAEASLREAHTAAERRLEHISGLSAEQARNHLFATLERNLSQEAASHIRESTLSARQEADARAREIVVTAIQRIAADQTTESTVSSVHLPTDEMKGRIIGREGRNIRALELATGVDLIIDDTPETVMISGFDPIRREIARNALTRLLSDGRIHPSRIEEVVCKAREDVHAEVKREGEQALYEVGLQSAHPELVRLMGSLRFRTSYGQNVLSHSRETALLCGMIAAELGCDQEEQAIAREAGLLHDLGKAVDHEVEGPHAIIGGEILARLERPQSVVHAVKAHHYDEEPTSLVAMIVIAADSISASRPGARRETLSNYIKRLEKLESIANSFEGVERSFAVQAGREIRIIVKPSQIDDNYAQLMARDIVKRIEGELTYPGQIKVTVIRETRVIEYAR